MTPSVRAQMRLRACPDQAKLHVVDDATGGPNGDPTG
jgi:hypothetical protein